MQRLGLNYAGTACRQPEMVQLQAGRPPFGFDTVQTEILKKSSVGNGNCSSSKCNRGYLHVLRGNGYEGTFTM